VIGWEGRVEWEIGKSWGTVKTDENRVKIMIIFSGQIV
jgi:hypothetical protein